MAAVLVPGFGLVSSTIMLAACVWLPEVAYETAIFLFYEPP
jgi:hypothetical protein